MTNIHPLTRPLSSGDVTGKPLSQDERAYLPQPDHYFAVTLRDGTVVQREAYGERQIDGWLQLINQLLDEGIEPKHIQIHGSR